MPETIVPGTTVPGTLYFWPNERSFTRQPAAEFHTFGSLPILNLVVQTLCRHGARLAKPGEFTLRAFLAGRLDLTQAEAVLSLIEAENPEELREALRLAAGDFRGQIDPLREQLIDLLAELEAGLDFVDEDIEFVSPEEIDRTLTRIIDATQKLIDNVANRKRWEDRWRVVFVGPPNAGKSSLLNALAGYDAALVSQQAGTTRDYLEVDVTLDGVAVRLIDTAGISAQSGFSDLSEVDVAAQRQTSAAIAQADVLICCREGIVENADIHPNIADATVIDVVTKVDQAESSITGGRKATQASASPAASSALMTSAVSGNGLSELRTSIANVARQAVRREGRMATASVRRCGDALERALTSLQTANRHVRPALREELVAAEVRTAIAQLGEVTGAFYTDDLLDRIFGRFCIGK